MSKVNSRKQFRKKRNKKKRILLFVLLPLLICLGIGSYFYSEYRTGLNLAQSVSANGEDDIEFYGVEDLTGKINVLLLGVDARDANEPSRTDTIMIAQYDPDTKTSKVISIMRDTYLEIPGYGFYKVNTANALGGPDLLRQTIKHNFNLDIQYYALVNFDGFSQLIDTAFPNGIEIEVEKTMSRDIGLTLNEGLQTLNGKELLGYVRFRKDAESDFGRVRRQQQVMETLTDELVSVHGLLKSPRLIGTIQPYIQTNITNSTILGIATSLLLSENIAIDTLRIPADDTFENKTYPGAGMVLDINLEQNKQILHDFLDGKLPTEETPTEEIIQ
ncbi:LCP family protein [Bacillus alkalicellulosilyticus]|uniref:LCP family protein n=1 Tax=Alkalihalobacterium alkalicellulosilyticum TaxID=1912214 RepID=UPI000998C768|nr:LCP family protein [Bacillus alkalicellulosilyticus]